MEVVISKKVLDIVELYIRKYRTYHQGLFEDSWNIRIITDLEIK